MKRLLAGIVFGFCLALFSTATVHAADCQFVLGFKTIRDLIGYNIVGECLDNEHYNDIGDSVQHTTGGLLAWRKADNWTAFTDGYRTWVNGPNGLQQRLNTERFEWEADFADFAPAAATPELTRNSLRNADYAAGLPTYGTLQRDRIGTQDPLEFGDLNGDGVDDAVAILFLIDGNAGHLYLAAVLNENGAPRHVASAFLGLNIGIDSVVITDGIVTLQTKQLGPNDPTCCPTKEVVVTLRLTDNSWQLLAETPSGQITTNLPTQLPAPSSTLDPTLSHAFHILRTTWKPVGEQKLAGEHIYQIFLLSNASATFGPLDGQTTEWSEPPPSIVVNEVYRDESPEALAHTLIWPTLSYSFFIAGGVPQSWDKCVSRVISAHSAQAQYWLARFGKNGKQNPTRLEQWANRNLTNFLNDSLGTWVRSAYREPCAQYGEPPPKPAKKWHLDCRTYSLVATSVGFGEATNPGAIEGCVALIAYDVAEDLGLKPGTAAFGAMKRMLEMSYLKSYYIGLVSYLSDLYPAFGEPGGIWEYVVVRDWDETRSRSDRRRLLDVLESTPVLPEAMLELLQAQPSNADAAAILGQLEYGMIGPESRGSNDSNGNWQVRLDDTVARSRAQQLMESYWDSLSLLPNLGYLESPWYRRWARYGY